MGNNRRQILIFRCSFLSLANSTCPFGRRDMLKLLPEEECHETMIVVYTAFPLSLGENSGSTAYTAADRIAWNGKTWKLVSLQDWPAFGYCRGTAVLTEGEDL